MKFLFLFLFTALCINPIYAQKQGNIWFFGEYGGLDFNSGSPVILTGGQIHSVSSGGASNVEGCSVISDSAGHLLFYADGVSVWNKRNNLMPNGSGLLGGISSTQAALIVPRPGSSDTFYIFTTDQFQNNLANGFRYSMVDMCLDNGLGDVITGLKNIFITDTVSEKLTATYHENGKDIWVVVHKQFINAFYAYLLTDSGLSAPVISYVGWADANHYTVDAIGQMVISPNGKRIAFTVENTEPNIFQLFDFNDTTGVVNNLIDLPTSNVDPFAYGVAFSPDNSKLYLKGNGLTSLNQFDINAGGGNPDSIINSEIAINSTGGVSTSAVGMQLGPDGKIYASGISGIDVINFPNEKGQACGLIPGAIAEHSEYTLPEFINSYQYKNGIPSCAGECVPAYAGTLTAIPDTICSGSQANVILTNNTDDSVQWLSSTLPGNLTKIPGASGTTCNQTIYQSTYFAAVVGQGNCADTSKIIQLYVPPTLTASFTATISGNTVDFKNSSVGNIRSYHWDFSDGTSSNSTNPTHIFSKDTVYYVCLTIYDGTNCSYTYCQYVDLGATPIYTAEENDLNIFPNPNSGDFTITLASASSTTTFTIYDLTGRQIYSFKLPDSKNEIQLSNELPEGMYICQVKQDDGKIIAGKLIIVK